jgi:hypothetical protein
MLSIGLIATRDCGHERRQGHRFLAHGLAARRRLKDPNDLAIL